MQINVISYHVPIADSIWWYNKLTARLRQDNHIPSWPPARPCELIYSMGIPYIMGTRVPAKVFTFLFSFVHSHSHTQRALNTNHQSITPTQLPPGRCRYIAGDYSFPTQLSEATCVKCIWGNTCIWHATMPNTCIFQSCKGKKAKRSLFSFPRSRLIRQLWVDEVRATRRSPNWEPTQWSRVCEVGST